MKIFILVVLLMLLISRIKNTPAMISKKLYIKKMQGKLDKQKDSIRDNNDETVKTTMGCAIIFVLLFELFLAIFYIALGTKFSVTYFTILSAIQVITVICSTVRIFDSKIFSQNIEDYKFYRWYFLLNVILDYIYYPVAIYLLMR